MEKVETLISTMNQTDFSLLEKMNVSTDCVVVNQCGKVGYFEFKHRQHFVKWINSNQVGLSKSRNLALSYSSADICVISDDDEVFYDGFSEKLLYFYKKHPKTSLITFNIDSIGILRKRFFIKKEKKLHFFNIYRYGSARISFKREFVLRNSVFFNITIGAGTERIPSGEDNLFVKECLKHGARPRGAPISVAKIDDSNSGWFSGFDENYFVHRGELMKMLHPIAYPFMDFQYLLRHKSVYEKIGFIKAFRLMTKGRNHEKN